MAATFGEDKQEGPPLPALLDEFRTALREEIEAAKRASSSAAVELISGRRVASRGAGFQYVFFVETALNLPDDSPADLHVPALRQTVPSVIVASEGLSVTLSVQVDLGKFIPRARLQSDLTHLLRTLIQRIEALANEENAAGGRLLGHREPSGAPADDVAVLGLNEEQKAAVRSGVGRDTTFVWGPPGTGKTRTIGSLGAVLHAGERSVLVVSHTNAAVDQALLRIAEQVDPVELDQGKVVRLGETKERMLAERPELLAQTHIERRSSELIEEREQLLGEQGDRSARLAEVERLLELAAWLPQAPAEIRARQQEIEELAWLERAAEEARDRAAAIESELEPLREAGEAAEEALRLAARSAELAPELAEEREREERLKSALGELEAQRREAEKAAQEAKEHVPRVREARQRVDELRAELPEREPLLAATDAELAELRSSIRDAEAVLVRAESANALTRRLRGLPSPDAQRPTLDALRLRLTRLAQARDETAANIESLSREFRQAEETIERYGHLPDPDLAEQSARALRAREERARSTLASTREQVRRLSDELIWSAVCQGSRRHRPVVD